MPCTKEVLQYRDSKFCKVSKALEVAESRLRQKALVEAVATGSAGVGCFPKSQVNQVWDKVRYHLLQEEVRAGVEEEYVGRSVGQGAWTRWESTVQAIYDCPPDPSKPQWAA